MKYLTRDKRRLDFSLHPSPFTLHPSPFTLHPSPITSILMIRLCNDADIPAIFTIINDAAQAYRGAIPDDCWNDPYMPEQELRHELASGVVFWGYEENNELVGVMGIQDVADVTLIRHSYVRTAQRRRGIGAKLLSHLRTVADKPILIGTWKAATWAVRFYRKHGFRVVPEEEKNRLLRKYWTISDRQIETSLVLAEAQTRLR
ncbi:MAG: GNAT family N-acetyltransferase [Burkholderiales bacterium]